MKRRIAVVLGAIVFVLAAPAVANADPANTGSANTGSMNTGSAAALPVLLGALPAIWQECGLLLFTGQCGGVVTQPPTA